MTNEEARDAVGKCGRSRINVGFVAGKIVAISDDANYVKFEGPPSRKPVWLHREVIELHEATSAKLMARAERVVQALRSAAEPMMAAEVAKLIGESWGWEFGNPRYGKASSDLKYLLRLVGAEQHPGRKYSAGPSTRVPNL